MVIDPGFAEGVKLAYTTPGSVPNWSVVLVSFANSRPPERVKMTPLVHVSVAWPCPPRYTLPDCRSIRFRCGLRLIWNMLFSSAVASGPAEGVDAVNPVVETVSWPPGDDTAVVVLGVLWSVG